jgi:hypothetical protein
LRPHPDPRTVDTLIRIFERVAKLHGLEAPQRIERAGQAVGRLKLRKSPTSAS